MNPAPSSDFDHPWLIQRIPEEILARYRKAMFRVRSSNEPLVTLDALADMQEILQRVERAAVAEALRAGRNLVAGGRSPKSDAASRRAALRREPPQHIGREARHRPRTMRTTRNPVRFGKRLDDLIGLPV